MTKNSYNKEASASMLNENELAFRWGISVRTLRNRRVTGGGPTFVKLGRSVRYRVEDVEAFEGARLFSNTSQSSSSSSEGRSE
jgi:hypothetical protein